MAGIRGDSVVYCTRTAINFCCHSSILHLGVYFIFLLLDLPLGVNLLLAQGETNLCYDFMTAEHTLEDDYPAKAI